MRVTGAITPVRFDGGGFREHAAFGERGDEILNSRVDRSQVHGSSHPFRPLPKLRIM
jgi:hypothetical protein